MAELPRFRRRRRAADATDGRAPLRGVATSLILRPGPILVALCSIIALALVSAVLAWRQYDSARRQALNEADARAVAVNAILDISFTGQVNTLEGIAKSRLFDDAKPGAMHAYLHRLDAKQGALFNGGIFWVDRAGRVTGVGTPPTGEPANVSDRLYFRHVVQTHEPYVSSGLIGRQTGRTLVVISVPTFGSDGTMSGVLGGSLLIQTGSLNQPSAQALSLGYSGLTIVDSNGRLLRPGLPRFANTALLRRIRKTKAGIVASTAGIDGHGSDAVAYATSSRSGWITVLDRPRSELFASARRALVLELASVGASALLVVGLLTMLVRRARRREGEQRKRVRSWTQLTRQLMSALDAETISRALLDSIVRAFPDAIAYVRLGDARPQIEATVDAPIRTSLDSTSLRHQIGRLSERPRGSHLLAQRDVTPILQSLPRRPRRLHVCPVLNREHKRIGVVSLLNATEALEDSDWELLDAFADQAAAAVERTAVFSREHALSLQLQRALLPDRLPTASGMTLSGHYVAGAVSTEVGGDWYDAVLRGDGILQLCIGDVSGRGVTAATVMGGQRNAFQAYALEYASPAEVLRRMTRHVHENEFITVACVSIDPLSHTLTYAIAGHVPPLLVDEATGEVTRLDRAATAPLGVARPETIAEARIDLPPRATLALYTDGLVERRDSDLTNGIEALGRALTGEAIAERVVADVSNALGKSTDDQALLLVALDHTGAEDDRIDVPADPTSLPAIRRQVSTWLVELGASTDEVNDVVLAVSEACNNAIEHGYRDRWGTITLTLRDAAGAATVIVEDHGRWRETGPPGDRGRGLALMRQLMDTVEIERTRSGTRVTLTRALLVAAHIPTTSPVRS